MCKWTHHQADFSRSGDEGTVYYTKMQAACGIVAALLVLGPKHSPFLLAN